MTYRIPWSVSYRDLWHHMTCAIAHHLNCVIKWRSLRMIYFWNIWLSKYLLINKLLPNQENVFLNIYFYWNCCSHISHIYILMRRDNFLFVINVIIAAREFFLIDTVSVWAKLFNFGCDFLFIMSLLNLSFIYFLPRIGLVYSLPLTSYNINIIWESEKGCNSFILL